MDNSSLVQVQQDAAKENIKNSGGLDPLIDIAESALDTFLYDDVTKEVPALRTLISICKLANGIRDRIFQGKIFKFIKCVKDQAGENLLFAADIKNDEKIQKKAGEHLCLILEKLDDLEKIPLLAKAFIAFLRTKIDFTDYRRLAASIDRCFVPDTKFLTAFGVEEYLEDRKIVETLSNAGFIELSSIPSIKGEGAKNKYAITDLGRLFFEYVLK
jgi:hypothetical protein